MALILADRVRETTSTAGTGTVTLDGAVTGYQSFSAIGNGNTTYYCIAGQGTTEWEVGIGTYTSAGTTLSRDTVLSSSNSGSKVVFSAGTKDVFVTYPSGKSINQDASGNTYVPNLGGTTPAAGTFTTLTATGQTSLGGDATNPSLRVNTASGPTRWIEINGTTASSPQISAWSTGAAAGMLFTTRGSSGFNFTTNASTTTSQFQISHTASAVNYWNATGSATTQAPIFSVAGSDSNISQVFQPKGTGAIDLAPGSSGVNISNGGTVTAITRTANGSNYTSPPTVTISPPTTSGGVQATATITLANNTASGSQIASGGTGYTLNDTLTLVGGTGTAQQLTVTGVSGGVITNITGATAGSYSVVPTNPISVTGGTGSGATFNMNWNISSTFTITNAGSGYVEQPTVSFSGGGGSGAAAYATVGSIPKIQTLGSALSFYTPGGEGFRVVDSGSTSTQYWQAIGSSNAILRSSSTGFIESSGANAINLRTNSGTLQLAVAHTASAVNYVQVTGGPTSPGVGSVPTISVQGSDSTTYLGIGIKGTGGYVSFYNNGAPGSGTTMFRVKSTTGTLANYVAVTPAIANSAPIISADGSDTNLGLNIQSKGTGAINLQTAGGTTQLAVADTASAVNYWNATGSATTKAPILSVAGSDTNISQVFQPKGTGAIDLAAGSSGVNVSNGGTVTAITSTNPGSGYTSVPTVTVSAPTTAGGVQAIVTTNVAINVGTIGSGGTGYTVGDTLTLVGGTTTGGASTWTVATVSAGVVTSVTNASSARYTAFPSLPASVTGGTGSGFTFSALSGFANQFVISNAGSGYVEQPTVSFSGGGGSSAAAYATVGGTPIVRSIGSVMSFYTPGGEAFRVVDNGNTTTNYVRVSGNSSGNGPSLYSVGGDTNVDFLLLTKGTGNLRVLTNQAQEQLRVSHTASAVNYVQVTGAATTARPTISAQGSDSNIDLSLLAKNNGSANLSNGNGFGLRVYGGANYLNIAGNSAGIAPVLSSQGTDTNIDLALTPKGTGALVAQASDGGVTINARGANAVDWQTLRSTASQVASGAQSTIAGGLQNTSSASYSSIGGGAGNTASATASYSGGGYFNTASGTYASSVGGWANTSSGYFGFVGGGYLNTTTSNSAVTTQVGATTSASTAVTLTGSNASIKVGQYITGTGIATNTYVAAISGTSLTLSQNAASTQASTTLSFFTPHGIVVGGGNNQATGAYSFIGGGGDAGTAGNRNVASGDWSFVGGGIANTASGLGSVVAGGGWFSAGSSFSQVAGGIGSGILSGSGNTASGDRSAIITGYGHQTSATGSLVGGGFQNYATGQYSTIINGYGANTRSINFYAVFASRANWNPGGGTAQAQTAILCLSKQTTDATASVLVSDTGAAGTTNQVILPNNSAYYFRGEVISGVTGGGNTKGWYIEGVIKRGANAASTALVGTPTVTSNYADAGASTWTIAVTADTTNGGLAITFTGQASTTIRTVAQIRTTEMTY